MSSSGSSRSLSKGTLGLKFMNRVHAPGSPAAQAQAAASAKKPPTESSVKAAPAVTVKKEAAAQSHVLDDEKQVIKMEEGHELAGLSNADASSSNTATPRRTTIVHESSLLSFPLLSASYATASSSQSNASSTTISRPAFLSGRMSFGGANVEIEQLHNPTPPATVEVVADGAPPKKRKKGDSDSTTGRRDRSDVPRAGRPTSAKGATWHTNADEVKLGSSQNKPKIEDDDLVERGFARPKGFEDVVVVKKRSNNGSNASQKPSLDRKRDKGKGRVKEEEPVWRSRGEARDWDAGKDEGDSSEEGSEMGSLPDESSDSDDSDEDVADLLVARAGARGGDLEMEDPKGNKARMRREVDAMIAASEEGRLKPEGVSSAKRKAAKVAHGQQQRANVKPNAGSHGKKAKQPKK